MSPHQIGSRGSDLALTDEGVDAGDLAAAHQDRVVGRAGHGNGQVCLLRHGHREKSRTRVNFA